MSIVLVGSSSGSITLQEPAVAGTTTLNLPATSGTVVVTGTTPTLNGITFPATQVPSADANTLDDYEEGTWTPNQGAGLTVVGAFSSSGSYTKVGRMVYVRGQVAGATSVTVGSAGIITSNLPITAVADNGGSAFNANLNGYSVIDAINTTVYSSGSITSSPVIFFSVTYQAS